MTASATCRSSSPRTWSATGSVSSRQPVAARDVAKVLKSATANAENNFNLSADELHVQSATADEGPTLKRFRPRAQGRTFSILKRTSHITVTVADREES